MRVYLLSSFICLLISKQLGVTPHVHYRLDERVPRAVCFSQHHNAQSRPHMQDQAAATVRMRVVYDC